MPSKTWTALAAARPLVCTADAGSQWEQTLLASGAAAIARPEDPASLAKAIVSLYQKRDALPEMGRLGRAYVTEHLSRERATKAYFEVLTQIGKKGETGNV